MIITIYWKCQNDFILCPQQKMLNKLIMQNPRSRSSSKITWSALLLLQHRLIRYLFNCTCLGRFDAELIRRRRRIPYIMKKNLYRSDWPELYNIYKIYNEKIFDNVQINSCAYLYKLDLPRKRPYRSHQWCGNAPPAAGC